MFERIGNFDSKIIGFASTHIQHHAALNNGSVIPKTLRQFAMNANVFLHADNFI